MKIIVVLLIAAFARAEQNDWLIVPGQRVGPITRTTTRADLDRIFGKSNVTDKDVDTGEGPEPATVVDERTPADSLVIVWKDKQMSHVMICYPDGTAGCKWHTAEGITLGTDVEKLQTLNGRPFQFEPWGSDLGGGIGSWDGGKLETAFGEGLQRTFSVVLNYPQLPDSQTPEQRKWLDKVSAPAVRSLSSQDEAVRHMHPTVDRLVFKFAPL
jgi:hypothetical protein